MKKVVGKDIQARWSAEVNGILNAARIHRYDLAEYFGISRKTLGEILKGESDLPLIFFSISPKVLRTLANANAVHMKGSTYISVVDMVEHLQKYVEYEESVNEMY